MTTFTLHWSPRSPYVRKALVALHEKGLADRVSLLRTHADPLIPHEGLMAINPLSKIPTLEREGEAPIFDSRVVMEWADHEGQGPCLFPAKLESRWHVLSLEAIGNGVMDLALPWLVETRMRPEAARYQPQIDAYRRKMNSVADWLETRIETIGAEPLHAGHIAIGVALAYLDFRFDAENWRAGRAKLAAWHAGFSERPSMQATQFRDDPRPTA